MAKAEIRIMDPKDKAECSLSSREFSDAEQRDFLVKNLKSFTDILKQNFDLGALAEGVFPKPFNHDYETVTVGNTTVHIFYARRGEKPAISTLLGPSAAKDGVPELLFDHKSKIPTAARLALEWTQADANLAFPNNELYLFCAESTSVSVGYLCLDKEFKQHAAILLGKTAAGWSGGMDTKTVAQECYDHYRPAWLVNAVERRILATLVHEMGHVFHQAKSLAHYRLLARVSEILTVPDKDYANSDQLKDMEGVPTRDKVSKLATASKRLGESVSNYAWMQGMNEFVAEVFCALVMGSPLGGGANQPTTEDVLAGYQACGGIVPSEAARHVRKGDEARQVA